MLFKFGLAYLIIGFFFALSYHWRKEEDRLHVLLAVCTGWPIFLWSMIGAGWHALLGQEKPK